MTTTYKVWLQTDSHKRLWDASTKVLTLNLTEPEHEGVLKMLLALSININAMIDQDRGQEWPRNDMHSWTVTDSFYPVTTPDIPHLYECAKYIFTSTLWYQPRFWALFKNPFSNPPDLPAQPQLGWFRSIWNSATSAFSRAPPATSIYSCDRLYLIIPFTKTEELNGVLRVYEWLGFTGSDYLIKIQDNTGKEFCRDQLPSSTGSAEPAVV